MLKRQDAAGSSYEVAVERCTGNYDLGENINTIKNQATDIKDLS
jgi:hypothetical protein